MLAQLLSSTGIPVICLPASDSNGDVLQELSLGAGRYPVSFRIAAIRAAEFTDRVQETARTVSRSEIFSGCGAIHQESANYEERLSRAFGVEVVHTIAQAAERIREIRGNRGYSSPGAASI